MPSGGQTSRGEVSTVVDVTQGYSFARESYAQAADAVRPLLEEHWRELATYSDVPLDPDWGLYQKAYEAGNLRIFTARLNGVLVGYAVYFVRYHHHYASTLWAMSDVILVRKEHRSLGVGNSLFALVEESLREEGVGVIQTTAKLAHPELSVLLEMRGHARNEVTHTRRL